LSASSITDPVEQAEYREYAEELTAKLLAIYKYRERERRGGEEIERKEKQKEAEEEIS
jgi:hypothetical protein